MLLGGFPNLLTGPLVLRVKYESITDACFLDDGEKQRERMSIRSGNLAARESPSRPHPWVSSVADVATLVSVPARGIEYKLNPFLTNIYIYHYPFSFLIFTLYYSKLIYINYGDIVNIPLLRGKYFPHPGGGGLHE